MSCIEIFDPKRQLTSVPGSKLYEVAFSKQEFAQFLKKKENPEGLTFNYRNNGSTVEGLAYNALLRLLENVDDSLEKVSESAEAH